MVHGLGLSGMCPSPEPRKEIGGFSIQILNASPKCQHVAGPIPGLVLECDESGRLQQEPKLRTLRTLG